MFTKPKKGDSEEDILKQQFEFYKQKGKDVPATVPDSKTKVEPVLNKINILGNIIERKSKFDDFFKFDSKQEKGFPEPFLVTQSIEGGSQKKSMFALHMEKKKKCVDEKLLSSKNVVKKQILPQKSVFNGPDMHEIHEENLKQLESLGEEEILKQQKLILESMDSNLIQFLKRKRSQIEEQSVTKMEIDHLINTKDIPAKLTKFDNMNKWSSIGACEPEKLEWMGDIPDVKTLEPNQSYSARFDFKGALLPYVTEIDVRQSLHHHGEEPERPGYTLQELYQLSRSSVLQQRILAINTIANITSKVKLGYYDTCFDGHLLQKMMDCDILLLLRFSLDENTESLVCSTINCAHKLICNHIDEVCLDKCMGMSCWYTQPNMSITVSEIETPSEEKELQDNVIFQLDLTKGILRTDLLIRFNYLINTMSLSRETMIQILEILIRIVRHSNESCNQLLQTPGLLNTIYSSCILSNVPYYQAVKLFRVICSYPDNSDFIVKQYKIIEKILSFVETDKSMIGVSTDEMYNLKLESLYLWHACLFYGKTIDLFQSYTPNLIRLLHFYFENVDFSEAGTNFDFDLFSAILFVVTICVKHKVELPMNIFAIITKISEKWLSQFLSFNYYNFSMLKSLGNIFYFLTSYFNSYGLDKSVFRSLNSFYETLMNNLLSSTVFNELLVNLKNYSILLSKHKLSNRDPKNHISMNSVCLNGENYVEIIQNKSPFSFIVSLNYFLIKCFHINNGLNQGIKLLMENKNYRSYFEECKTIDHCHTNWWLNLEIKTLCSFIQLERCLEKTDLKTVFCLLRNVHSEDHDTIKLLFDLIFDISNWDNIVIERTQMSDIKEMYEILFLTKHTISLSCDHNFNSFYLPIDWSYLPIMQLYNKKIDNTQALTNTLEFVNLIKCNELNDKRLSPVSEYCRLGCVFLTENFDNPSIAKNLKNIFIDLMKMKLDFDFCEDILGISSFYDFFTELLQQFSAVSYGNVLFSHFILLPLFNKYDSCFRKLIWSEYLHVLKVITINEFDVCYNFNISDFIEPIENDPSLLMTYLHNIGTQIISPHRNPMVFKIALENLKNYLTNFENVEDKPDTYNLLLNQIKAMKDNDLKLLLMKKCDGNF